MFIEIIGHIANFLYTAGSSFKSQIYLRLAFVLAACFEIYYGFYSVEGQILWTLVVWAVPLLLINAFYFIKLMNESKSLFLTPEEERIYYKSFSYIDKQLFKKILDKSKWINLEEKEIIIKENTKLEYFYLINEGIASISLNNKFITFITEGIFIGEMSFLTNSLPKASVICNTKMKLLKWDKEEMLQLMEKDRDFENAVKAVLSNDLVAKIERLNLNN